MLYDISKFLCLLLMALGVFFFFLQRKTKIDRNLPVFAVRNLSISLFCAIYLWGLKDCFSMTLVVAQHVLVSFFPPLFVCNIMYISNRPDCRVIKSLFAAAVVFSALFAAGVMLSSTGWRAVTASLPYTFLFEPYMLGTLVYLLCLHAANLKNTGAQLRFMRITQLCGLVLFYCFAVIVTSSRITEGGLLRLAGLDASDYMLLGVFGMLGYCVVGAMTIINNMTAMAAAQNAALANLREAYRDLETTKPLREIGQSAAFINHEIKNYMMVISGYAALLARSKTLDGKDRAMVDNIAQTAAKLQDFNMSVLELSKSNASREDSEFDLAERLKSCVDVNFNKQQPRISVRCAAPQNTVLVNGSAVKIERALINALRNSLEAGARGIDVRLYVYNYMALAVIEDDGAGCDAARLPDFFTTFFTTKEGSGGTGLGLCVIRSIVEAHGGSVSIYTKNLLGGNERGLSMQIVIPASKKTPCDAAMSEVMLVKEGLGGALSGVMAVLKNLKIIPRVAERGRDVDAAPKSRSLSLIILAAAPVAADVKKNIGGDSAVRVLSINEGAGGTLLVNDADRDRVDLFTEEYIVRYLCNTDIV